MSSTESWNFNFLPPVHCGKFELAIIKLQSNDLSGMDLEEKKQVKELMYSGYISFDEILFPSSCSLSFTERALKRRKMMINNPQFADTRFILPTANLVERMFSKYGYTFSKRRKSVSPSN